MALVLEIPIELVQMTLEHSLIGFEGFVLVWGVNSLRVYKEVLR